MRAATERLLRLGGYQVLSAGDGVEALARARAHAGPIHLLVTDVVMANMGGVELARQLRAERPGLRVLYISRATAGCRDCRPAIPLAASTIWKSRSPSIL